MYSLLQQNAERNTPIHGGLTTAELRSLGLHRHEVIDFSVNINPLGTPPEVREALNALDISSYPDPACLELKEAIASAAGVSTNRIVIGNGTTDLIYLLVQICAALHNRVAVLTPAFGEYETAARRFGTRVIRIAAREGHGFRWDIAAACEKISLGHPDLVFLCNPNNPTGAHLDENDVRALIEASGDGLVVLDDSYAAFADRPWDATRLLPNNNLVILHSMTKEYALAGLRLGYALCAETLAQALIAHQPPWSVNAAAQAAGVAALSNPAHLARSRLCVQKSKRFLQQELRALGLTVLPSEANFMLVHTDNAALLRHRLLTKGLCVRDCTSFGLPRYIRIGVRTEEECQRLIAAFKELTAAPESAPLSESKKVVSCKTG